MTNEDADRIQRVRRRLIRVELAVGLLAVLLLVIALATGILGVGDFGHPGIRRS